MLLERENMADLLLTENQISGYIDKAVSWLVRKHHKLGDRPFLFIPVMDGALPFFMEILKRLEKYDISYDYAATFVSTYDGIYKGRLSTYKAIQGHWQNYTCVVVDDIYDSGESFNIIRDSILQDGNGIDEVYGCFLIRRNSKFNDLFSADEDNSACYAAYPLTSDKWLFGFGMDLNYKFRGNRRIFSVNKH